MVRFMQAAVTFSATHFSCIHSRGFRRLAGLGLHAARLFQAFLASGAYVESATNYFLQHCPASVAQCFFAVSAPRQVWISLAALYVQLIVAADGYTAR